LPLWRLAWLTCIQSVGSIEDAWRRVFNKLPSQDGIHVKCGQGQKALERFWQICNRRCVPCMKFVLHDAWCGRRRRRRRRGIAICITIVRNWLLHSYLINTASWYSSPNKKKIRVGLWRLPYFYKVTISITILGRAIMVTDTNRFHYFEDGILFLHGLLVMPVICLVNHTISSSICL
jgi:hypothetical protein